MRHPILEKGSRIAIWWLAWVILAIGQSLLFFFFYKIPLVIALTDGFISMILFGSIGLLLWFPLVTIKRTRPFDLTALLNIAMGGGFFVFLWISLSKLIAVSVLPELSDYVTFWDDTLSYRVSAGVLLFGLVVMTYYLFISAINLAEKASRQAQLEALVKEAELKVLRSQLNPHFLFNSLNSISSLTITDPEKARDMIVKLSEFMRYSLSGKNEQPVTLRQELDNLHLYLDIEKIRFRERLICEEDIDQRCMGALMPSMLLQPLYENAIKYGVYESTEPIVIKTTATYDSGNIRLSVYNTIDPTVVSVKKGTGTGLSNVRNRLNLFFGGISELLINRSENSFTVILLFPMKRDEQ